MTIRRLTLLVLILASSLALAPSALGDADPASDILLGSSAFYPFQPAVSQSLQTRLNNALAQLNKKGLNLKVAIIGSPIDLGAIPNMFGKPQTYADFLGHEISFQGPQPLLVVMPAGFGISDAGPAAALNGLKVDAAHQNNGLAGSAIQAVGRIAQANGKPISAASTSSGGGSSSGTSPLITFGVPVVVLILAAVAAGLLRRRRAALGPSGPGGRGKR